MLSIPPAISTLPFGSSTCVCRSRCVERFEVGQSGWSRRVSGLSEISAKERRSTRRGPVEAHGDASGGNRGAKRVGNLYGQGAARYELTAGRVLGLRHEGDVRGRTDCRRGDV